LLGVKAKLVELMLATDPATGFEVPSLSVNVVEFTEPVRMASLNVAVITPSTAAQSEPFGGVVDTTVGGVVSGMTPVVNVHE
jgi:hypothetical protein